MVAAPRAGPSTDGVRPTSPERVEPDRRSLVLYLAPIVALGAALRFSTLDARSYWVDEAATAEFVRPGFGDMLSNVANESTPPLYYVLAWLWSRPLGTGEIGLRSLSALLGTATILVVYATAAHIVSRRAGLLAALLAALSPLLVWHSQDARSYALVIFLAGLSFLGFVHALERPRPWVLAGWAASSSLLLASHYFAVFLVVPEAVWLLLRHRRMRVAFAVAVVGAVGLGLLVLIQSAADPTWIGNLSLASRIVQVPAQFVVGYQPPLQISAAIAGSALTLVALWLLLRRAEPDERRAVFVPAVVGGIALLAPISVAVVGYDRLLTRAVTPAWIPLVIVMATGLASRRVGRTGMATVFAIAALFLWIDVTTADDPKFEREDWRGAAQAIGPRVDRAIVLSSENALLPMAIYRPNAKLITEEGARVTEIVVIGTPTEYRKIGEKPKPPRPRIVPPPAPGFTQVERVDDDVFTFVRFRSPRRALVGPELAEHALGEAGVVLVEES